MVDSTQGRPAGDSGPGRAGETAITAAAYIVLLLLGMLEGLIGTFHYSNGPGVLLPILFALAILVTCILGAYGMRSALGGLLPAVGWYVVSLLLSTGTAGGSVLIADTSQGKWFLFGGAICAAAGAVTGYVLWSRASRERRERLAAGPGQSVGSGRSGQFGAGSSGSGAGRLGGGGRQDGAARQGGTGRQSSAGRQNAVGQNAASPDAAGSPAQPGSGSRGSASQTAGPKQVGQAGGSGQSEPGQRGAWRTARRSSR
jgi:hypothetical protein